MALSLWHCWTSKLLPWHWLTSKYYPENAVAQTKEKALVTADMEIEQCDSSSSEGLSSGSGGSTWVHTNLECGGQDLDRGTCEDTLSVPEYLRIDPVNIRRVRRVGRGSFSKVYEATWLGCTFAVKKFKSRSPVPTLQKELDILIQLCHPQIVQLVGMSIDSGQRCSIVMDFMSGNLRKLIKSRMRERKRYTRIGMFSWRQSVRPFDDHEAMDIIRKIAWGMTFLHSKEVVHGDLKSLNVMVRCVDCCMDVKLVDFGLSQIIADSSEVHDELSGVKPDKQSVYCGGSGFWRAPEILRRLQAQKSKNTVVLKALNEKIVDLKALDVYSFAMTCYEVLTGKLPFEDEEFQPWYFDEVISGARPTLPVNLNLDLKKLIDFCWHDDPKERPSFENICCQLDAMTSGIQVKGFVNSLVRNVFLPVKGVNDNEGVSWVDSSDSDTDDEGDSDQVLPRVPDYLRIDPSTVKMVRKIRFKLMPPLYEATWLGSTVAVMKFRRRYLSSFQQFHNEVEFMCNLRHPRIVQLVGFSTRRPLIVREFMSSVLRDLIKSRMKKRSSGVLEPIKRLLRNYVVPFEFKEAVSIITSIALGMAFLHSKGVVHRNLKSYNVMVQEHIGRIDVKITDFVVARLQDYFPDSSGIYVKDTREIGVGTGYWRAPEILPVDINAGKKLDLKAADVYSFAMTCYEVLTGKIPLVFLPRTEYNEVIAGLRPELPSHVHPELKALIHQCWDGNPERRPNFTEICDKLTMIQTSSWFTVVPSK